MKKIISSIFLLAFVCLSYGQNLPINEKTNKVTFIEVVDAPGMKASELEKTVKDFMKEKPYTLKEETAGSEVVYAAYHKVSHPAKSGGFEEGKVNFTFSVFFKDDKYRIILTDFVHEGDGKVPDGGELEEQQAKCGPSKMTAKAWVTIKNRTNQLSEELIAELEQKILEVQNDPAKNDDW